MKLPNQRMKTCRGKPRFSSSGSLLRLQEALGSLITTEPGMITDGLLTCQSAQVRRRGR